MYNTIKRDDKCCVIVCFVTGPAQLNPKSYNLLYNAIYTYRGLRVVQHTNRHLISLFTIIVDPYGLHFTIYICKENDFYIKTEVTMNLHFTDNNCDFTSV